MANFCGKCGAGLDTETGLCPNCDKEQLDAVTAQKVVESEPKRRKSKALTTTITILLSTFLFFTLLFTIAIGGARNTVKEGNATKMLDNIQVTDLLDITPSATHDDLQRFYSYMDRKYGIEMTDRQFNDFINKSTVKEFMADKVSDFSEDFFEDDAELTITKRELVSLLKENSSVMEDEFEVSLTNSELREIADWIFSRDELVIIDTTMLKDRVPALYYISSIGFSYVTMAAFIILSVLIIFLMMKNSISQAVCAVGIEFVILGGVTGLGAMLAAWLTPLWKIICADSFMGMMFGNFMAVNVWISLILFVLGIAMLVIRGLVIKHRAKK